LAKSLNCQGNDGQGDITAHPCGVCEACVAIDAGRFVDYIEMDAASNRGVDDMAQLLEQAVYAPSNARFKVYMIDEVHMLSSQAFNSMLKTLEEPPTHVKFILATTDPQKIPVTVLSRCLQFNLKQMAPAGIVTHLESILAQEQISFESPALRLLAQGAQGSMRDALSLTDQAIAYAAGQVTLDAVQGMLGALDHSYLVGLLDALSAQDGVALLAVADDMATRSLSFSNALQDLGTLLNRIAIAQTVPAAIPDELPEREDILRLASVFTPEDIQLCYQIVVHGRNELGLAPDEYAGFTMTLLRMLAFSPVSSATPSAEQGRASQGHASQGNAAQGHTSPQAAPRGAPLASTVKQAAAPFPSTRTVPAETSAKNTNPDKKPVGPAMAALAAARGGKSAAKAVAPQDDFLSEPAADLAGRDSAEGDTAQKKTEQPAEIVTTSAPSLAMPAAAGAIDWPALVRQLPLKGVAQQLATQSELLGSEDAAQVRTMKLRVPVETLLSAGSADKLAAALSDYFEKTVKLETEIGNVTRTAHAASVAEQARRQQLAEQTLNEDPFVQTLIREFGATIVPGSIKPV
jgi:DNA polymerase-3 subunit gamma/tau